MRIKIVWGIVLTVFLQTAILPSWGNAKTRGDYKYVFANQKVLSLTIEMTEEAFQKMQPIRKMPDMEQMSSRSMFAQDFPYVPASITCDGALYPNAGLRYRGNASIVILPPDGKKPLKMDFDRYDDQQNFHGFSKLNFINSFRDPSMLRDKLAYDLYNRAGVPAPQASFANLYLSLDGKSSEHLGFFVLVEQVNAPFLETHFGNTKGLLVKFEITRDLEYRGEDWSEYAHDHELKSDNPKDTQHLIQFLKFLTTASDKKFAKEIDQKLNVDRFLAWLAINTLLTDLDSYAGLVHNWYLYYNTDSHRFEFIPWDVNESFGNLQVVSPEKMLHFDIHKPYMGDRILIRRILAVEKFRALYEFYLRTFIRDYFNPEFMYREIERLHAFIDPAVQSDPKPIFPYEDFQKSIDQGVKPQAPLLSQEIIGLKPFVAQRSESVLAQLAGTREGVTIGEFLPSDAMELDPNIPTPPPQAPIDAETQKQIDSMKERLETLNQSILKTPYDATLYVQKGEILGQLIQFVEPVQQMTYGMELSTVFNKAVELDPNNLGGRVGRGSVRLFTPEMFGGDVNGAISDFEFVLSRDPNHEIANLFMGMALLRKDQKEDAANHLQKAIDANPHNQQARDLLKTLQP